MATVTNSKFSRRAADPTPEEIEVRKAEVHAARLAAFEAGAIAQPERKRATAAELEASAAQRREKDRLRMRRRRAAAKAAANLELQQSDEAEPTGDDHRDPRQTEQWLPVPAAEPEKPRPLTDRQRYRRLIFPTPEHRREFVQEAWDARREHNALAADANARGVLNYYNINRGPKIPYHDRGWCGMQEMSKADVCNVEFLDMGDLDPVLGDLIAVAESQQEMEDFNCRWNLGGVDPDDDVPPFKSGTAWPAKDVVPFRSKRR